MSIDFQAQPLLLSNSRNVQHAAVGKTVTILVPPVKIYGWLSPASRRIFSTDKRVHWRNPLMSLRCVCMCVSGSSPVNEVNYHHPSTATTQAPSLRPRLITPRPFVPSACRTFNQEVNGLLLKTAAGRKNVSHLLWREETRLGVGAKKLNLQNETGITFASVWSLGCICKKKKQILSFKMKMVT